MKIDWVLNYWPDFEPLPPVEHVTFSPGQHRMYTATNPLRWCACHSLRVYLGSGGWTAPLRPGETVSAEPLWDCRHVTRDQFGKNHHKVLMAKLAESKGFGYKCCTIKDPTPRDPFEVAERFGMPIHPMYHTLATNVAEWNERRKTPIAQRATGQRSKRFKLANDVARLI